MYDYWLNIVTVRATEDVYFDLKDKGGLKLEIAKERVFKLYDVCYQKYDFNTAPQEIRYSFRNERGYILSISKYVLNDYNLEFIEQEYKPYDIWHVRKEDVI